jgi:hypothetical protein
VKALPVSKSRGGPCVCRKVAHLKECEVRHQSGSFLLCPHDLDLVCAGCEAVRKSQSRFGGSRLEMANCSKSPVTVLESRVTSPGGDSTGAGVEREWSFDPQSKAELAQGEYKGAREVLARHVHTAEPRGGPGGGC